MQPSALILMNAYEYVTDSCSQTPTFQKQFPGKLEPALTGTFRFILSVKKTAGAFILHLALAEQFSYDISSCLLLQIAKDSRTCRDITGASIL